MDPDNVSKVSRIRWFQIRIKVKRLNPYKRDMDAQHCRGAYPGAVEASPGAVKAYIEAKEGFFGQCCRFAFTSV
jgi:hypothetical protein